MHSSDPTDLILLQRIVEGYTHTELATRFGLPIGTVKTRVRAGIAAMRQRLEHVV